MNRPMMIAAVVLAAYTLLDLALSSLVAIVWRTRAVAPANLPPAVRARRLLWLRLTPAVFGTLITLAVVTPAFAIFEPVGLHESMGPIVALLAITALSQLGAAVFLATRSLVITARFERVWLRSSTALAVDAPMPAFAINAYSPILALVGVFSPKLMAAQAIVDACAPEEVRRIVGHERGHLLARDNFKRWIMGALPDALRWTATHREIVEAWHHASEDAADDATTGGDAVARAELAALLLKIVRLAPQPRWDAADDATTGGDAVARAELAALLLKVVRLAPHPLWDAAIVSPFVERNGLERRVRRLLQPELEPPAPLAIVPMIAVTVIVIAALAAVSSPAALEIIFEAFERLVAFGR